MAATNHINLALVDSGIGGFSILHEIEQKIPAVSVSYFMDNLYLPYGELSEQALLTRLELIVDFVAQQSHPDLVVIACNTASTQSLDHLRARFDLAFVGVVPAIKPAAIKSQSGRIGLLATPATVNSRYIDTLIRDFAMNCQVQKIGSSALVHLAEQQFWQDEGEVNRDLSFPLFVDVDTVVLGCTHFPMIKAFIQARLPIGVELIDSGEAIANRVISLLGNAITMAQPDRVHRPVKKLFATKMLPAKRQTILKQLGFDSVEHVVL